MRAVRPHLLAQRADQVGVFGEALDQNGARAVERGSGIGHLLLGIDEGCGRDACGSFCGWVSSRSASGSSPASLAISALVRRFGLNGR